MPALTADSFSMLLSALDTDESRAAEKYEMLRHKLVSLLTWKGCTDSHADELADQTLDRVAAKIAEGEKVENVAAYAGSVARFIWLEHNRKRREDAVGDDLPEVAVEPDIDILKESDSRMECLRDCMASTIPNPTDRSIIIGYYDTESNEKNKNARKRLADSLGISIGALKVKACRLRDKLERCINNCVDRVTKSANSSTNGQEVVTR
jgi:DNA-directed RNA polymerase specialized sigma24 family protein